MKSLSQQLGNYACYHQDQRNIITHLVGIPMIVVAVLALLSRPVFSVATLPLTPALFVTIAVLIYYWCLHKGFGMLMTVLLVLVLMAGERIAMQSTATWLTISLGLFLVGWIFQFIGHYYEGRKPAFVDDLIGLAIGPLFVVAEVLFALGLCRNLQQQMQDYVRSHRPARRY
ncbi:hypothetical protein CWI84_03955 [Idiomarina tyrosinivorans]|uniref:DUF962 domain-containing protein n=1 Tax=Idiomarina tyrosinivorans TaxID=1445662 RepID=A0A432ZSD9_9GAMM|nr:Mpo1-like protein [Idiomarina tyrosinivorans]RUO80748.1 hypothetical protein CWI84_03955 [Idiomarina tyrosinivorans]